MTIKVFTARSSLAAVEEYVPTLLGDKVASRVFGKDPTVWGPDAEAESSIRLGWVDAASKALSLVSELTELRNDLVDQGLTRVVLCGMGGSSLAPEVITRTLGSDLLILDSTDPSQVREAVGSNIASTVVVVSSKSGSTVETDSQKRSFEEAFRAAGIDPTGRIFIVTDPESPMHSQAVKDGYRVFLADPMVGGRYSALTAFGLVPSMLAGVSMKALLEQAIAAAKILQVDSEDNPGLVLGAAIARSRSTAGFKDKIGLFPNGTSIVGFGEWVEQLIAESTGKNGRGVLPVVLEQDSAELSRPMDDLVLVELTGDASSTKYDIAVSGDLGELILLWEFATVVASYLLGVNPFDQPDVESAKIAARRLLDSPASQSSFSFQDQDISFGSLGYDLTTSDLESSLADFLDRVPTDGYVSIHCYLNRQTLKHAEQLRNLIAAKVNRPTTFGWGPRFLHSTGQYHKGGPKQGVFLQLLSGSEDDLGIPGRDFGYRQLIDSQSSGDARVLADNKLPVLMLQLKDPESGIKRLIGLLN